MTYTLVYTAMLLWLAAVSADHDRGYSVVYSYNNPSETDHPHPDPNEVNIDTGGSIPNFPNTARSGMAAMAYCVDLTWGTDDLPKTNLFRYKKLKSGRRCTEQGRIRIKKPTWGRSLSIHMEFYEPFKYTFNIGDAHNNNAYGGGSGYYNAEIYAYGPKIRAYMNRGGDEKRFYTQILRKKVLFIRLFQHEFYVTDYSGYFKWIWPGSHHKFFRFRGNGDYIYMGLNRVVSLSTTRKGSGLCNACLWWNKT